ncbi:MAG TPA: hypothetical protein VJ398_10000 [Acidimicrobiia bacterium]|nr:hypothetical protein [Acidimicrobiia bacterium]
MRSGRRCGTGSTPMSAQSLALRSQIELACTQGATNHEVAE